MSAEEEVSSCVGGSGEGLGSVAGGGFVVTPPRKARMSGGGKKTALPPVANYHPSLLEEDSRWERTISFSGTLPSPSVSTAHYHNTRSSSASAMEGTNASAISSGSAMKGLVRGGTVVPTGTGFGSPVPPSPSVGDDSLHSSDDGGMSAMSGAQDARHDARPSPLKLRRSLDNGGAGGHAQQVSPSSIPPSPITGGGGVSPLTGGGGGDVGRESPGRGGDVRAVAGGSGGVGVGGTALLPPLRRRKSWEVGGGGPASSCSSTKMSSPEKGIAGRANGRGTTKRLAEWVSEDAFFLLSYRGDGRVLFAVVLYIRGCLKVIL